MARSTAPVTATILRHADSGWHSCGRTNYPASAEKQALFALIGVADERAAAIGNASMFWKSATVVTRVVAREMPRTAEDAVKCDGSHRRAGNCRR